MEQCVHAATRAAITYMYMQKTGFVIAVAHINNALWRVKFIMGKKGKAKRKPTAVPHKEALMRMNFLYQVSYNKVQLKCQPCLVFAGSNNGRSLQVSFSTPLRVHNESC